MNLKICVALKLFLISVVLDTTVFSFFSDFSMQAGKYFVKGASSLNYRFLQGSLRSANRKYQKNRLKFMFLTYAGALSNLLHFDHLNFEDSQRNLDSEKIVYNTVEAGELNAEGENNSIQEEQQEQTDIEELTEQTNNLSDTVEMSNTMDSNNNNSDGPTVIYRKDYTPPLFSVTETKLFFDIFPDHTCVKSDLVIVRNFGSTGKDLILDGVNLQIRDIKIDGKILTEGEHYTYKEDVLTIFARHVPQKEFHFEAHVVIHPEKNFALVGLYKSKALYVTQCESTGFRHITFFIDRPDVMSKYEVTICADKTECPVLLSNGDKIEEKNIENNRHCAKFEDPHPKPSYLFGLVAGQLEYLTESYTTKFSKRNVDLYVYSEKKYVSKLRFALESLKKAMRFDEDYFSLEYDLSRLNLVAVTDYNMGAMENKGLNVFNVDSLLASKKTSTDATYERIVTVVSHEYFHNWTGNRVTLRDWFQLTLKEGLTVFREHLFSQQTVKSDTYLLDNVNYIRSIQFLEDASPLAHPIRPDSYITMDNFYTSTVYEKGSEVMRMYFFILGEEYYKKGLHFYLKAHDGHGATCEDFNIAMEKAYKLKKNDNSASLSQYMLWFSQSGTPHVKYSSTYDASKQLYTITFKQHTEPTKDQAEKKALFIPIRFGLVNPKTGKEMIDEQTLEFTKEEQTFVFQNIATKPLPSIFRSFSAPVHFEDGLSKHERILLMKYDRDSFVIYNCSVMLYMDQISTNYKELLKAKLEGIEHAQITPLDTEFLEALTYLITHPSFDYGVKAYLLSLPTDKYIMSYIEEIDTDVLYDAKKHIYTQLGKALNETLYKIFVNLKEKAEDTTHFNDEAYIDFDQINMRKLRNTILHLLSRTHYNNVISHIKEHSRSPYPTNIMSSITYSAYYDEYKSISDNAYELVKKDDQLLPTWLRYVVMSDRDDMYNIIQCLERDIIKDSKNPNVIRAVYYAFAQNTKHFHSIDGRGYKLLGDMIIKVDSYNPQLASTLCSSFKIWNKLNKPRQDLIVKEINKMLEVPTLSKNVKELLLRLVNKL